VPSWHLTQDTHDKSSKNRSWLHARQGLAHALLWEVEITSLAIMVNNWFYWAFIMF
jgi:hypothetical protein